MNLRNLEITQKRKLVYNDFGPIRFRPNTYCKNTNIYSNGNDMNMTKIKTTRASTVTKTLPL